ncbi:hypothetical protein WEH80_20340 [Actinomycetes bacterium KLBMP 9759]
MRGGTGFRHAICGSAAACLLLLSAACGGQGEPGPALPTFPSSSTPGAAANAPDDGLVPDDCTRVFTANDMGALFGLPLESVDVKTTVGVPAPSVGRTERLECAYTGRPKSPAKGLLVKINLAAYSDPAAAEKQWGINTAAEDGDHRRQPIGAANSELIERREESILAVVHGAGTLTLTLPERPLPGGKSRPDVLFDLALRALPTLAEAGAVAMPKQPANAAAPAY